MLAFDRRAVAQIVSQGHKRGSSPVANIARNADRRRSPRGTGRSKTSLSVDNARWWRVAPEVRDRSARASLAAMAIGIVADRWLSRSRIVYLGHTRPDARRDRDAARNRHMRLSSLALVTAFAMIGAGWHHYRWSDMPGDDLARTATAHPEASVGARLGQRSSRPATPAPGFWLRYQLSRKR